MKIISTSGKGNFKIERDSVEILELVYQNWFSSTASTTYNKTEIEIKSKNVWGSKFDIFKNQIDKGDIIFNWKGDIIIRLIDQSNNESSWLLKSKGFWKQQFELSDENDNLVCILRPNMNWSKLNYNYEIEYFLDTIDQEMIIQLIIYCGFGINLYMTMMAGVAAI